MTGAVDNVGVLHTQDGRRFRLVGDTYTIKQSSRDGSPSLTHLIVAPGSATPCHTHERYTEAFYILDGELEFTLGDDTFVARKGDFISVPPMGRHGFANRSSQPAEMLFTFTPGGMEELFYEFRTDDRSFDDEGYVRKARVLHGTIYEPL
jgi:quercetin dioxygenase-like cupin family protein